LLVSALVLAPACRTKIDHAQHAEGIRAVVSGTPSWVEPGALGKRLWATEQAFYESREHRPAWVDGDATTPQWTDLVQQLTYAAAHGLDAERYGAAEFEALREQSQTWMRGTRFPLERVPEMDARMTYAYLQYAADLLGWRRSPTEVHPNWVIASKNEDLAARLAEAVANDRVRDSLEELAPRHSQYAGLQAALAREAAAPSGRAEQIRMNMERWRWAPRDLGERYVLVNVPAYRLQVVDGTEPVLAMRVIVGEPQHPTPLFSDEMTHLVFSPYWNIPAGIMRDETLPRAAMDPDFLLRNNIEVLRTGGEGEIDPWTIDWSDESATEGLRFRQRPGASNALGLVKFMFPNRFSVYLHDTPGDRLFFKEARAFSHGCIRVEDPMALARYLLRDQPDWTGPRIRAAMEARRERRVMLTDPIPVHIGYWTAWVEPDGTTVTFTDDPYGIDATHARLR
jgi:murein L,D-transpeptidase YcbB/YkuD